MQETMLRNEQLQVKLKNLRKTIANNASNSLTKDSEVFKELCNQMEAMREELKVCREEVIQLKSFLAKYPTPSEEKATMTGVELLGGRNRMEDIKLDQMDKSELKAVLVKVYDHNRMLEAELETEKDSDKLRESIQQLGKTKKIGPFDRSSIEGNVQFELGRLSNENLELRSHNESLEKLNKQLKRQLKMYNKKLNLVDGEIDLQSHEGETSSLTELPKDDDTAKANGHPILRHKESVGGGAMGMLQYKAGEEAKIIQGIIIDFKPKVDVNTIPGLPAYLLFLLLRFADYSNDDKMIKQLLQQIINGIKKMEKKYERDFEHISFWLANTCRFLHNMKQYSGEEEFMKYSTEVQKQHCLRNFDLAEYRPIFSDIAISLFQRLVMIVVHNIKPMIVSAMLEHDSIQGLSSSTKPPGMRGRSSSREDDEDSHYTVEMLLKQLTVYYNFMMQHGIESTLVSQVFRQVFYSIVAHTLNNQLVRKELCNWSKAMQIRYNVSQLEEWIRKYKFDNEAVKRTLDPLVQSSQLMQISKQNDADAEVICETCSSLNSQQVVKLLQMITPTNNYEERVSIKFIKTVQNKMRLRKRQTSNDRLLMDSSFMYGVTLSYCPSQLSLNEIPIPENLRVRPLVKMS